MELGTPNAWRVRIDEVSGRTRGEVEPVTTPAPLVMRIQMASSGTTLVYSSNDSRTNIYRIDIDAGTGRAHGDPVAVTAGTTWWEEVDVSTSGRLVLRSVGLAGEDLVASAPDGSTMTPLTQDPGPDRFARWSPDGRRVAFSSMKSGTMETWIINGDGSGLRRVTTFGAGNAGFFPLWSPDGQQLAVTTSVIGGGATYRVDPDGPPVKPSEVWLQPPRPIEQRYRPWSWPPDGRRIRSVFRTGRRHHRLRRDHAGARGRARERGRAPLALRQSSSGVQ